MQNNLGLLLKEASLIIKAHHSNETAENQAACNLKKERYEWRGYQAPSNEGQVNTMILAAEHSSTGHAIGTMGTRIDGEEGLGCDETFSDLVWPLREKGLRLVEFIGLATDPSTTMSTLGALLHTAFLFSTQVERANYILMEVNPRHRSIYTKSLGFEVLSDIRECGRARAPALLLGQHAHNIQIHTDKLRSLKQSSGSRQLTSHLFSPAQESMVRQYLLRQAAKKLESIKFPEIFPEALSANFAYSDSSNFQQGIEPKEKIQEVLHEAA